MRALSLNGTRLTAVGKVKSGSGMGGQVLSRPYAFVSVPKAKVTGATSARLKLR